MRFTAPITTRLDGDAELVRRNQEQRLRELQDSPVVGGVIKRGVDLPNGIEVHVAHKLGRAPSFVGPSAIRGGGAGVGKISDLGSQTGAGVPIDRAQVVVLRADGYGGVVTVDLLLVP